MLKRLLVVGAVALAGGVIAACGGDDGPTQEEFVAEVQRACDAAAADLAGVQSEVEHAVGDGTDGVEDSEQAAQEVVEERVLPVFESLVSDLEAITPPEDDADDYDQLVANSREQSDLLAEDPGVIFDEESEEAQRAEELSDENDAIAAELGLPEDCGEPTGTTGATGATGAEGAN